MKTDVEVKSNPNEVIMERNLKSFVERTLVIRFSLRVHYKYKRRSRNTLKNAIILIVFSIVIAWKVPDGKSAKWCMVHDGSLKILRGFQPKQRLVR